MAYFNFFNLLKDIGMRKKQGQFSDCTQRTDAHLIKNYFSEQIIENEKIINKFNFKIPLSIILFI